MAITTVTLNTTFSAWKDITNDIIAVVGDNDSLTTTDKDSLVEAVNELVALIGDPTTLDTTEQAEIVSAINEVLTGLGDVANLDTTATTSITAINEVLTALGDISTLTTTITTTAVNAINSLKSELGTLSSLTTTDKDSLVEAVNEVNAGGGDLSALTTTEQGSIVGAVNELDAEIGVLSSLDTTEQDTLVGAINEVDGVAMKADNPQYTNTEPTGGRYATDALTSITASTSAVSSGILQTHNSSSFAAGEQFYNDNSNYGGAGSTIGTEASTLISALGTKGGRSEQRYGYEFFMNVITVGANTQDGITVSTIDYYPCVANAEQMLGAIGRKVTFMAWVKLKTLSTAGDNGIILGSPTLGIDLYIDDTLETDPYLLTVADGWVHMRQVLTLTKEFEEFFPGIFANESDVVHIALPVLVPAETGFGMHVGLVN